MKTSKTSPKNKKRHNISPAASPPSYPNLNPTPNQPPVFPECVRQRKLRITSFAAGLTHEQHALLYDWLLVEQCSVEEVRRRIAAPPPAGIGINVHRTTLRRLRALYENGQVRLSISTAMDTACDVLNDPEANHTGPLLQALSEILCAQAVVAARKQADPAQIHKLVTTIAKLEKLKTRPQRESRPATTRHRVELSVVNGNSSPENPSKVVQITATALPGENEKS